jgi:hypothetical protein
LAELRIKLLGALSRKPLLRDRWTRPRGLCHSQVMDKSEFDVRAILAGEAPKDEPVSRARST